MNAKPQTLPHTSPRVMTPTQCYSEPRLNRASMIPLANSVRVWDFLEENSISDEKLFKLADAFSEKELKALDKTTIKIYLGINKKGKTSSAQKKKASKLLSATCTSRCDIEFWGEEKPQNFAFNLLFNQFDHIIFLNCAGIKEIEKEDFYSYKDKFRVIAEKNINVVNILKKIAAHKIRTKS